MITLTLYHTIPTLNSIMKKKKKAFENIVGKGENAGNQHFHLFPQCFLPFLKQNSIIQSHLFCLLQMLLNLDHTKNMEFGRVKI